jgi:hypothetical protein
VIRPSCPTTKVARFAVPTIGTTPPYWRATAPSGSERRG